MNAPMNANIVVTCQTTLSPSTLADVLTDQFVARLVMQAEMMSTLSAGIPFSPRAIPHRGRGWSLLARSPPNRAYLTIGCREHLPEDAELATRNTCSTVVRSVESG